MPKAGVKIIDFVGVLSLDLEGVFSQGLNGDESGFICEVSTHDRLLMNENS